MARDRSTAKLSFLARMLLAVTIVMTLLVAISLWLVRERIKGQIHINAAEQLHTAEGVLGFVQRQREDFLFKRFNTANDEPKFKSVFQILTEENGSLSPEGRQTIKDILDKMITAVGADTIVLTASQGAGQTVAATATNKPLFNTDQFAAQCADSIRAAFTNQSQMDTIASGGQLYDVVSLPITVTGDTGGYIAGVVTFGMENNMDREFRTFMGNDDDLVLLLDGRVVSSTLQSSDAEAPDQFARLMKNPNSSGEMKEIELGDQSFWGIAGRFGPVNQPKHLGYLILSSHDAPLQQLRATQQILLLIGLFAIICGFAVVWFLVRRMTEPLRALQASAVAVGRGDFSRRVDIRTRDEFGQLGEAFNEMTQDIERSHTELQKTVNSLKTTQAQLVQSEKLSAVGEFVAGVAHELNNPLAAVMGFSEMLKDGAGVDEETSRHLDLIFKSALRCRKIVQSLLSFARRHQPERKPVAVNKLVEEVLEIVAYQLRTSNVEVVTQFAPKLPLVLADGHQVQQVILNLINNARQAIEAHQKSGCITISTAMQDSFIRISVQDDGPGIPDENLSRIFDPFFTTKEVGKGTGLGLSLCYGLIKEHGGSISVTSQPGKGATFTVELPVSSDAPLTEGPVPAKSDNAKSNEGAGKKILLVDDEDILLEMIRDGLKYHGYDVITANSGEAALREFHAHKIDAICTDLKMPGLTGRQLYEWIRASRPDAARRVILMTGDLINDSLQMYLDQEKLACLHKPFSIADLRQAIKNVLKNGNGR